VLTFQKWRETSFNSLGEKLGPLLWIQEVKLGPLSWMVGDKTRPSYMESWEHKLRPDVAIYWLGVR
jgi:hypothetical protein